MAYVSVVCASTRWAGCTQTVRAARAWPWCHPIQVSKLSMLMTCYKLSWVLADACYIEDARADVRSKNDACSSRDILGVFDPTPSSHLNDLHSQDQPNITQCLKLA